MATASSLAAAIEGRFGIAPKLLEGHDGIFKVVVKGDVVYSNASQCGLLPTNEEVLWEIRRFADPIPGKEREMGPVIPMFRPK